MNPFNEEYPPQTVVLSASLLGRLLGVDQVAGSPVALDEAPGAGHVDRVPGFSSCHSSCSG